MKRALALAAPLLLAQAEPRLVPDVSQREVRIIYSFTGAELLAFGAIVYPDGRIPGERVDVAVVLKGPVRPIVLREKQQIVGIWMNAESARFRSAPSYYAVASSRPLAELVDARTAAIYELGLGNLQLSPGGGARPEQGRRMEAGLVELMRAQGLYVEDGRGVEITGNVLYRARIPIPAKVPVGDYTAETFLIRNGRVIAGAVKEVRVDKAGFERFVADAAERYSFAYGLAAVALSLLLGWAASAAFRRRGA